MSMLVDYVPPRRHADDGSYLSCTIGVIRPGHGYRAGSVQHDSFEQAVAGHRPCRFCDTPVTRETIGCAIVATPRARVDDVYAVNAAVCRDCDSGDDLLMIDTMAKDLAKNPQLRAQVHVVADQPPPPNDNRQARRRAERQARKRQP
jgi:hypothetical protein